MVARRHRSAAARHHRALPWLLGLSLTAACAIDEHANPAFGCDDSCKACVRGFCLDGEATLDAGIVEDAGPAIDAAEAGPSAPDAGCDAALEREAPGETPGEAPAEVDAVCDACGGTCAADERCCDGVCSAECSPMCGNGARDSGEECDGEPNCTADCKLRFHRSILHRYDFAGTGRVAVDSIGDKDGALVNVRLTNTGDLQLAGGMTNQHVDLPNGLIRGLANVTVEVWVTWRGTTQRQRLFDFGFNEDGEGEQGGMATSYLYATPSDDNGNLGAYLNVTPAAGDVGMDKRVAGQGPLSMGVQHQVAVVFDGSADSFQLYLDGNLLDVVSGVSGMLAQIDDRNVWLGRANVREQSLEATLHDVRIYGEALTATAIANSYAGGTDP
jgi:hypothetical protein